MKVVSTDALTKLIQLIKSSFVSNTDVEQTSEITIGAYITETYSNGSDWYRVWSDGWCEQGGSTTGNGNSGRTVSLLKTYSDTNYNIQAEITDYTSGTQKIVSIGSKTTSDFKAYTSTTSSWGSYAFDWCARGYVR